MMNTPTPLTLSQPRPTLGWPFWLSLWALVLCCQTVLLLDHARLDTRLWLATRSLVTKGEVEAPPPPTTSSLNPDPRSRFYKSTERFWEVFKLFGEPLVTAVIAVVLGIYERRRWLGAGAFVLAGSLAGGLGALIRCIAGRVRPTHIDGANQWVLWRGFHDGKDLSWPSGHATLAFATAAVLCYLSPRGRWLFLTLATGCAVSRVMMQAHFWSDILLGAALGWTIGWITIKLADPWINRINKSL